MKIFILQHKVNSKYIIYCDKYTGECETAVSMNIAKCYSVEREAKEDAIRFNCKIIELVAIPKESILSFVDKLDSISDEIQKTLE